MGGHTFNRGQWESRQTIGGRPLWMDGVSGAAKSRSTLISFTLDCLYGRDGETAATTPQEAFEVNYERGLPMAGDWRLGAGQGNGTAWELAAVGRTVRLGDVTG
ncbi:polymorphic toxin type 27 domain-containing protein [Phytohabitans houttuyneae]|uniref:polymorphic toxin type 27 domain-containing protein n=1 Tax=Phytohabitans houttuyneae TaxID=1076126 RepID=UPI0035306456